MNKNERINSELKKQLSVIVTEVRDPRVAGMVSVTSVTCDADMTLALVYVSVLGAEGREKACIEGLQSAEGFIKSQLKARVKMRALPKLRFIYDDSLEHSLKINQILSQLGTTERESD